MYVRFKIRNIFKTTFNNISVLIYLKHDSMKCSLNIILFNYKILNYKDNPYVT